MLKSQLPRLLSVRARRALALLGAVAFATTTAACSANLDSKGLAEGARPPAPAPATADAGAPGASDTGSGGENAVALEHRCGAPPYQAIRLGARDVMAQGSQPDLASVTITLKHCPQQSFVLGPTGDAANLLVTAGVETWIRFDATGYVPWVAGEVLIADGGRTPLAIDAMMMPRAFVDLAVPAFLPDAPVVFVQVRAGRADASPECRSPAGVTLSVKNHPRASILYRAPGATGDYRGGQSTSEEGVALITNLPAEPFVEIVASKPGCIYQMAYGDASSSELLPILRAPLFAGAITHQVINPLR